AIVFPEHEETVKAVKRIDIKGASDWDLPFNVKQLDACRTITREALEVGIAGLDELSKHARTSIAKIQIMERETPGVNSGLTHLDFQAVFFRPSRSLGWGERVNVGPEDDGKKTAMIHLCIVPQRAEVNHGREFAAGAARLFYHLLGHRPG